MWISFEITGHFAKRHCNYPINQSAGATSTSRLGTNGEHNGDINWALTKSMGGRVNREVNGFVSKEVNGFVTRGVDRFVGREVNRFVNNEGNGFVSTEQTGKSIWLKIDWANLSTSKTKCASKGKRTGWLTETSRWGVEREVCGNLGLQSPHLYEHRAITVNLAQFQRFPIVKRIYEVSPSNTAILLLRGLGSFQVSHNAMGGGHKDKHCISIMKAYSRALLALQGVGGVKFPNKCLNNGWP